MLKPIKKKKTENKNKLTPKDTTTQKHKQYKETTSRQKGKRKNNKSLEKKEKIDKRQLFFIFLKIQYPIQRLTNNYYCTILEKTNKPTYVRPTNGTNTTGVPLSTH